MRRLSAVLWCFIIIGVGVPANQPASVLGASIAVEGVTFADEVQAGHITMPLQGVGLAKFLRTINVYAGALYLAPGVAPDRVLEDVPKRLELSYFRAIQAGDFGKAALKVLADNVPEATIARLKPRIEHMHGLYENVQPGDRYQLTYLPGVGTELSLNGVRKGVVEGADFASAYFSIWLGSDPINETLKEGLLHRRNGR